MDPTIQQFVNVIGVTSFSVLLVLLAIWSLIWKGIALWKAARSEHKIWYIVMLIVNTAGILEIIYILFFNKKNKNA
jgi:methionyl-tRNA synthetase